MKILIQLVNIKKNYGANTILDNATVSFAENQKVGIIGRNGAGKSTMCKIITGHEEEDGGTVVKHEDLRLSYLEQHDPYRLDETVIEFLMRYCEKEEWECGKIANKFQLKNEILNATIGSLAGGFRTRVKLTAMLLREPNFLILDEPTNYLDLKTLILLEEFLQNYRGGFIIVSHDREFLKKTCDDTLEIENGECTMYPGSVEEYLIFKEEQKVQAISYNKNVEAKQKQLQDFVNRFRAKASKAKQAQSKMKQIEKLKKIEIDHPLSNVQIKIPQVDVKKSFALHCTDLEIGYPENLVANNISLEIAQGSHVAVLGDNGQGKTTFLRTIADDLEKKGGEFRWGYDLKIAYYAQHVFATLDGNSTVYNYLYKVAAQSVVKQEILNLAGSFLFRGSDVDKKISVLSGGERARVCLAGILLSKSQVILLDEPTNHLDFETVEALGRALKLFSGTLFFISHDRTFVNMLATEIIEVQNGAVRLYPGIYEDYVYHLENILRKEMSGKIVKTEETDPKQKGISDYHLRKEIESEKKSKKRKIEKTLERIAIYKKEYDEIHEDFIRRSESWSFDRNARYEVLAKKIEEEEIIWVTLTDELDAKENLKK
ncbi:MAG: ABC-F family ATP-binding cassette domain-containing protein [Bacteroidetes bacterium]|nr:ABC-F family ATP-binding cassette domain-containing protein [Bacteroidota bacterium]